MTLRRDAQAPDAPLALVTRPEPGASELAGWLDGQGFRAIRAPLLRAIPLTPDPESLAETLATTLADPLEEAACGVAAVVFTSAAGVRAAPCDPALRRLPCWCVGEATAEVARAAGFAEVRAGPADAATLGQAIRAATPAPARLLHLRGRHGGDALAETLAEGGLTLRALEVYEMQAVRTLPAPAEAALASGAMRLIPIYSPRTGRILARLCGTRFDLGGAVAVAISDAAAAPLAGLGLKEVRVAETPAGGAMRHAMRALREELG